MATASTSEQAQGVATDAAAPFETPFLEVYGGPIRSDHLAAAEPGPAETPFLTEYLVGDEVVGGASEGFRELLAELRDSEFDEALAGLVDEADARAQLLGLDEAGADPARVERALHHWLEPLRMEAESLLDQMGDALAAHDAQTLTDEEVDRLLEGLEPGESAEGPVFEDFLKKLWKKAKSAVKGAARLAKKGIAAVGRFLPIGIILKRLRGLVRPLLTRVLKIAMNRLPPALRPAAAQLARRFLGVRELEAMESAEALPAAESPAAVDLRSLQLDFDAEIASLLLAPEEPELESLVAEANLHAERLDDGSLAELDEAREDFVNGLAGLEQGEDPTPLVEQFLPAILPALRIGIGVIGRPKVVNFLAKFLGRLIAPYVGPQLTQPLSRAIVDAGLRLMTLEAGEEEQEAADPRVAAEAFAALVEDTVSRVAELDEDELEDEGIVEEVAFESFHRAARGQFPASVLRGGGRASGGRVRGVWVGMPRRGRRRYRKYSRVLDVTISPEAAALVQTRGGRTLAMFLRDRLGRTGPVQARLHLYQAIPGTRLGRIARAERAVPGLGPAATAAHTELHPLTREAAGALLGEPELGAEVSEAFLDELAPAAVGQRFYYLEVAGGRPAATMPGGATATAGAGRPRLSTTTATIDARSNELRVAVYLSEAQAQDIAARLRRKEPLGALLSALLPVYAGGLRSLASAAGRHRLRIIGETEVAAAEQQFILPGLPNPAEAVGALLTRWTRRALASQLLAQRDALLTAAAGPHDGVTLVVRLLQPPGLSTIARLARGRLSAGLRDLGSWGGLLRSRPATAKLEIVPGYRRA